MTSLSQNDPWPPAAGTRASFFRELTSLIPLPESDGEAVFLGIDGVDGAGKTTLADDLADYLADQVNVVRISIDGFHDVRERRYRRGRDSPEGFWLDSYDYAPFLEQVVRPFRAGAGGLPPGSS